MLIGIFPKKDCNHIDRPLNIWFSSSRFFFWNPSVLLHSILPRVTLTDLLLHFYDRPLNSRFKFIPEGTIFPALRKQQQTTQVVSWRI